MEHMIRFSITILFTVDAIDHGASGSKIVRTPTTPARTETTTTTTTTTTTIK